jgi:hypothetical protein
MIPRESRKVEIQYRLEISYLQRSPRTGRWEPRPNVICFLSSLNSPDDMNNIPAGLRSADIGRFAIRAAQIEKAKPVVAYWCECPRARNPTC